MRNKKITFKYVIRQLHLILGLVSGIVVFIVALTGSLHAFEDEIRATFQHSFYHVQQPGTQRVPLQQMTDTVKQHYPKDKITSIRFTEEKDAAVVFLFKKDKSVSINPYTSKINGFQNLKHDFLAVDLDIHTHLMMGEVGGAIIKANVLIFFVMCVSGLILWWPKQKRFFKQAATINFKTKNWKRLNWDLHSVFGFYALIILITISLTGMFFVYDSAKNTVAFLTRQPSPVKEKKIKSKPVKDKHFSIDEAYTYSSATYPGAAEVILTPPADSVAPIRVVMRYPYAVTRKQNTVYFNRYTGKVLKTELYNNYTAYDVVARTNHDLHTGQIHALGIFSKIIYFLAGLMAASLPVTGFMIWLGKRKKTKKSKSPAGVLAS
jgi:uncharacterized iron-regulated membrane protein